jgi:hypothetical protein|tara:strand:- start:291 stop:761 length:471 start_codon:yes stop_codon:yes gene_type:complete
MIKNINVYDNVLSDDLLHFIQIEIHNMLWEKHVTDPQNPKDKNFSFACQTDNFLSHQYLFNFFCKKYSLNFKRLRSYVNCYPPQGEGKFHPDDGDYTFLFYPDQETKGKGATIFKNNSKVEYKTNRLLIFNSRLVHKAGKNLSTDMRHSIAWKTLK